MAASARKVGRGPGVLLSLVVSLAIVALGSEPATGEQAPVTREMLVTEAERTPGPTKGREGAPVTIVEFSDFQCGFCRKVWKETLPRIEAEYIHTGKARFVYPYLLGVVFSFAFCPTLFWLFFGLTVPLALRSAGGLAFPGLFAVGASLPLLAMTVVVGAGVGTASFFSGGMRRVEQVLRVVAGTVLILAGLHDTIVYWLL